MIRQLSKSIREYKAVSIWTPALVFLEVVMECIIPFIISKLVNSIEQGCEIDVILRYGVQLVLMAVLSLTFGSVAGVTCAKASCGFGKNLRRDMFYSIQDYSFENIDKFSTSSLVTRLTTDIANVQNSFMMIIRIAVRAPFMMVFALVMAIIMGGKLAIIFAGVIPVLTFGLIMIAKKAMPIFRKVFKKYDKLNSSIQENVKGMRVVKSFVRENYESSKFAAAAGDVCADFTKAERILAFNGPVMMFCMYSVMIFVLTFGSYLVISSSGIDMGIGQLTALLTYGFMILTSLMMVSMIFVMLTLSAESAKRICEVINEKPTLTSPDSEVSVKEIPDGSIDFENVTFKYSSKIERNALSDICLHIDSGETVGIIGSTGSSKSTFVQMIPRLYDTTSGEVKVGGVNVKDYDLECLRNGVAVVLQKNILFSGTIKDNLRWGNPDATDEEMKEACRLSCADEFIKTFPGEYDYYVEQAGANLSGGQKQRLCIARALLKKPKILIMDDSTSAVDTKTDASIRRAMREYIPETTKLIIAQRTSSVEDADRIIVLDGGRIYAEGTHAELLKNCDVYRDIYISQNKAGGDNE